MAETTEFDRVKRMELPDWEDIIEDEYGEDSRFSNALSAVFMIGVGLFILDYIGANGLFNTCCVIFILFVGMSMLGNDPDRTGNMLADGVRACRVCGTIVTEEAIMESHSCRIASTTTSVKAVKSANPIVGISSAGGNLGVAVGSVQSTSHVPVTRARLESSVRCPACSAYYSWVEEREITEWTDSAGQPSYEYAGTISLPKTYSFRTPPKTQ